MILRRKKKLLKKILLDSKFFLACVRGFYDEKKYFKKKLPEDGAPGLWGLYPPPNGLVCSLCLSHRDSMIDDQSVFSVS